MRSVILGPSGSGKTILLQNMILDIYRDCFSRIYIFSPSIDVDMSREPVNEYKEKHMKVRESDEDPKYFDNYDSGALEKIIHTQDKLSEYMEKEHHRQIYIKS